MIGVDTSFLVAFEIAEHSLCTPARTFAKNHASTGFAIAPQVLTEFIHVATDGRRFANPLSMTDAVVRARRWWEGREVHQVFPTPEAVILFHRWILEYGLGRKRLLDTMLAATYVRAKVTHIVSTDARDFKLFPPLTSLHIPG